MSHDVELLGYLDTELRVRFGETDRFGYMWHGWVLAYFERARADIARRFDLTPSQLLEFDLTVPMVDLRISYKNVAYDDEELTVQATLLRHRLRLPVLEFFYRIMKRDQPVEVARGWTKQVLLKTSGKMSTRIPPEVTARMQTVHAHLETCPRWDDDLARFFLDWR